ncbi:hypothetical protein acdb102_19360 [Acidothermaceae bacterium B102]|nr:hypothetical protein acdb102_19360 [Acidothermaceae bacterium B102]
MASEMAVEAERPAPNMCWCCGVSDDPARLVHLGDHPEVAVCTRCAHSISKWAWEIEDQSRTGPAVRGRDTFRRVRRLVVQRGWQNSPLIGRPLRWLGRHTP